MATTINDLWFVIHGDYSLNLQAPLFTSLQIVGEVQRANLERRDGRTDWRAIDLEAAIFVYGENRAKTAINQLMLPFNKTRH